MSLDNFNNWQERFTAQNQTLKKLLKFVLDNAPREMLITMLKKRGILERDWLSKGEKYVEKKSV